MSKANRFAQSSGPCVQLGSQKMRDEHIYYVYMMQSASR